MNIAINPHDVIEVNGRTYFALGKLEDEILVTRLRGTQRFSILAWGPHYANGGWADQEPIMSARPDSYREDDDSSLWLYPADALLSLVEELLGYDDDDAEYRRDAAMQDFVNENRDYEAELELADEEEDLTTFRNLDDLMQAMGSDATDAEARAFRDALIERGLLDWDGDHLGGTLSSDLTDDGWVDIMSEACREVAR